MFVSVCLLEIIIFYFNESLSSVCASVCMVSTTVYNPVLRQPFKCFTSLLTNGVCVINHTKQKVLLEYTYSSKATEMVNCSED